VSKTRAQDVLILILVTYYIIIVKENFGICIYLAIGVDFLIYTGYYSPFCSETYSTRR